MSQVSNKLINLETYVFTFGKYIGEHILDVIDENPNYVLWCHNNVDWFKLTDDGFDYVTDTINGTIVDKIVKSDLFDYEEDEYYEWDQPF